jgi:hypothetical protein
VLRVGERGACPISNKQRDPTTRVIYHLTPHSPPCYPCHPSPLLRLFSLSYLRELSSHPPNLSFNRSITSEIERISRPDPHHMSESDKTLPTSTPIAAVLTHHSDDGDGLEKGQADIEEVQGDQHFYETVTTAPLNPLSKTSLQLYAILLVAALNATASGFDGVSGSRRLLKEGS